MYMKMFYFDHYNLNEVELVVNTWVTSVQAKCKIMNISPPAILNGQLVITVVYVER
jgi:hypothetical protein